MADTTMAITATIPSILKYVAHSREILSDIAKATNPKTIKIIKIAPIIFVLNILAPTKIIIYGMTILSECYILFNIIEYK